MKNYNLRYNYEQLVVKLSLIANEKVKNLKYLSDYQLLCRLNELLVSLNLIPFTEEELEMDLA
ncbi:MAG: hypothetical protein RIR01_2108 [Bacteroidota bacterium]|jgi:hypothetical protein